MLMPTRTTRRLLVIGLFLFCFVVISGCSRFYNGEKLFHQVGCIQCHSFKGKGGSLAPDLSAVTNIRSDDWIIRYLDDPKKMNPRARMPSFKYLSTAKREAIISFLKK